MKSVNKYTMILIVGCLLLVGILHHPSSVQTLVNIQSKKEEQILKTDIQNSYSVTKIVDEKRESSKFVFNEDPSKAEMPITARINFFTQYDLDTLKRMLIEADSQIKKFAALNQSLVESEFYNTELKKIELVLKNRDAIIYAMYAKKYKNRNVSFMESSK